MLRVFLSLEPVKFISGAQEIENYLLKNNFIITPKHATNSAWAKQGEEYLILNKKINKNFKITKVSLKMS